MRRSSLGGVFAAVAFGAMTFVGRSARAQSVEPVAVGPAPATTVRFGTLAGPNEYEVTVAPSTHAPVASRQVCTAPCELRLPAGRWRVTTLWADGTTGEEVLSLEASQTTTRAYGRLDRPRRVGPPSVAGTVVRYASAGITAAGVLSLATSLVVSAAVPTSSTSIDASSALMIGGVSGFLGGVTVYLIANLAEAMGRPPTPSSWVARSWTPTFVAQPDGATAGAVVRF